MPRLAIRTCTVFVLMVFLSCESNRPKPDGRGWVKCPRCHSRGSIEYFDNRDHPDAIVSSPDPHSPAFTGDTSNCCLSGTGSGTTDINRKYIEKLDADSTKYGDSGRGVRYKACPVCKGVGWIKDGNRLYNYPGLY